MDQALRDCGDKVPIVAHRKCYRRRLITMTAETFFRLLRGELPPADRTDGANATTGPQTTDNRPLSSGDVETQNNLGETPEINPRDGGSATGQRVTNKQQNESTENV